MAPDDELDAAATATEEQQAPPRLNLDVTIEKISACERSVAVSVPREDIDRYFANAYNELETSAAIPGFRPGKAPRKLIENRFRKEVAPQVKSSILVDSLTQLSSEQKLAAIGEPDLDVESVELPTDGPLTFNFKIEVRPEFDLPEWKGLEIERPTREILDADVTERLNDVLASKATVEPKSGPAAAGDLVDVVITTKLGDRVLLDGKECQLQLLPTLHFYDATLEGFADLLAGASAGDKREGKAKLSDELADEALKGQEITVEFTVKEVSTRKIPELTPELLSEFKVESEDELKQIVRDNLVRRLEYEQDRRSREQVLGALTKTTQLELPPDLLRRQARRELERAILELRSSGFADDQIRAYGNELRQNTLTATSKALREHFVLERIAEENGIDATEADFEDQFRRLAEQSNESVRKVRAQLEKNNQLDSVRNY
ncbi:MAG TPA: trigger factor, partial [Pirellulales bacterium]